MSEWIADPRKEPIYVQVRWTDAAHDNTFACSLTEVGRRATLMHNRLSDGRLVYLAPTGRESKVVLASLYDAPDGPEDEAMVENFMIIPWGWVESIKVVRGPVIYEREPRTPTSRAASGRSRRAKEGQ